MRLKRLLCIYLSAAIGLTNAALFSACQTAQAETAMTEISSAEDLLNINKDPAGNYKLTEDIDLTELTKQGGTLDTGHGWSALADSDAGFTGTFDGNGHQIKGLHVYGDAGQYIGLFGYIKGGSVTNLGLVDCSFENITRSSGSGFRLGAIAGRCNTGTIENCYVTGSITAARPASKTKTDGTEKKAPMYVGGITGGGKVHLSNCYGDVNITVSSEDPADGEISYVGGIIGYGYHSSGYDTNSCYSTGTVHSLDSTLAYAVNGIAGTTSCYYLKTASNGNTDLSAAALTEDQMKDRASYEGFDFENAWNIDTLSEYPYPQLRKNFQFPIKSFRLIHTPDTLTYPSGSPLDLTGGEAELVYQNGTTIQTPLLPAMISGYDPEKIGEQTITVFCGGKSEMFQVTVTSVAIAELTLSTSSELITKGESAQITAAWKPENATETALAWTSSNPSAITVDDTGFITAVDAGSATITAAAQNGVTGTIEIRTGIPCTKVSLNSIDLTMNKGAKKQLIAKLSPADTTSTLKSFTSSDTKIATVTEEGLVTAVGAGTVKITAETSDGITAVCTIKVVLPIGKGTISSVKNTATRKLKATAKKLTYADGYQFRYSKNSNMTSAATKTTTAVTITSGTLTKGKKYYVQVRGYYLNVAGSKVYGSWSAKKAVTIKK